MTSCLWTVAIAPGRVCLVGRKPSVDTARRAPWNRRTRRRDVAHARRRQSSFGSRWRRLTISIGSPIPEKIWSAMDDAARNGPCRGPSVTRANDVDRLPGSSAPSVFPRMSQKGRTRPLLPPGRPKRASGLLSIIVVGRGDSEWRRAINPRTNAHRQSRCEKSLRYGSAPALAPRRVRARRSCPNAPACGR